MSDTSTLYEQPSLLLQQQFNPATDLRRKKACWLRDSFARIRRHPWTPPPPLPPMNMHVPLFYSPPPPPPLPLAFYHAPPMVPPSAYHLIPPYEEPWITPIIVLQQCCCNESHQLHRPGSEKEELQH